ncbi:MAG TPA: hypothetical protein VME43_07425 [Bryobacteraceae bacterium]|nr:hypothetical protein [Bryobacteraceae bacterium]
MTITVEISPEVQAELARQAAAHGQAVETYAASLIEEATRPRMPKPAEDMVELFAPLRGLNIDFERDRDPGRDIRL